MVGLLGFVLSAISLPGGTDLAFTLEMFGGLGQIIGIPVSVGRGKLAWWFLPVLAAGVFIVLRVPLLFGEDWRTVGRAGLQTLVAALALAGACSPDAASSRWSRAGGGE
jgi:hypothetical protein